MISNKKVEGVMVREAVITKDHRLYDKYMLGEIKNNSIVLSLYESLYALEKNKLIIMKNGKKVEETEIIRLGERKDKMFLVKYSVFKDLRDRGYIPKSGLKFGADFRLYNKKNSKHSKWLIRVMKENEKVSLIDLISRNRVAHSTAKKLIMAIVDKDYDVTYIGVKWMKNLD